MEKYNSNRRGKPTGLPQRRSIRLKGYDYSQAGLYFITICTQNHECLFGNIVGADLRVCPKTMLNDTGKMILNDAGKTIEKWYYELENKFPDIKCDEMIIMPNHFHCIVENVGADLRVCPKTTTGRTRGIDAITDNGRTRGIDAITDNGRTRGIDAITDNGRTRGIDDPITDNGRTHRFAPTTDENISGEQNILEHNISGEHVGSPLHRVVQWFKTMSTNEYIRGVKTKNWEPFDGKLWQRNYWEHIIRNEKSYHNISNYIINNPKNWDKDKLFNSDK